MEKTIAKIACAALFVLPAISGAVTPHVAAELDIAPTQTIAMVLAGLMIMATIVRRRSRK